ncbi:MAG: glycosyltransferase family 4 protein [Lewinellaceae bacterium]|nr:glycosyltransferase family 4 protein [Saprospiraceae bacterium]MCB9329498.1 glycosyltransferase family 4 protein [Lewinellaceae bacterium]
MPAKKILLVANTAWNLWNYRRALIGKILEAGYDVVLAAPPDRFQQQLQDRFSVRFVPLKHLSRRSFSILKNVRFIWECCRLYRRERPDLVLLFTIKPNILGNIAARLIGISTLSVIEGLGYSGTHAARWRWLAAPLYRLALKHQGKVVFLNHADRQAFCEHKLVKPDQTLLIHGPGVDTEYFKAAHHTNSEKVVFLYCSRLLIEKGIREFVEAARKMKQLHNNLEFHVLGDPDPGNPATLTETELQAWKRQQIVQFFSSVDDVRPYLAQADVLVLPSYYREGVPRTVLEAMAMEKIIVTTEMPGCRDTVEEGENGFLVLPKNVDALIEAMQKICTSTPENRRQMGAYSRQKVLQEFSDQQILPQYLNAIKSLTT